MIALLEQTDHIDFDLILPYIDITEGIVIYAIEHHNENFMRASYYPGVGDKLLLAKPIVFQSILKCLAKGSQMLWGSLLLAITPLERVENQYLRDIIKKHIDGLVSKEEMETNKLFKSENAIQQLVLCAEACTRIADNHNGLKIQAKELAKNLLDFTNVYISKISDEKDFKTMMLEKDLNNRTVLDIAIDNEFHELFMDEKAQSLINTLWFGDEYNQCTKRHFDFSVMHTLLRYSPQFTKGTIMDSGFSILSQSLQRTSLVKLDSNFWHQYRYRRKHIGFLYCEDFIFTMILFGIFVVQVFRYIESYQKDVYVKPELDGVTIAGAIFSGILLYSVLMRVVFNFITVHKISIDLWTTCDLITGVVNLVALGILQTYEPPSTELYTQTHYNISFYMIAVIITNWARFFILFLIHSRVSPMISGLVHMISATLYFLCVLALYIFAASIVFYTLYVKSCPSKYADFWISLRSTFDDLFSNWDYECVTDRAVSFSIITIIHSLIASILLLNYLIAILSDTFAQVKDNSMYHYKSNLLAYLARFSKPLSNMPVGFITLYPTPFNGISILTIPFLPFSCGKCVVEFFAHVIFWIENIFLLALYCVYFAILNPFVYFKVLFSIISSPSPILKRLATSLFWIAFSPFILLYLCVLDAVNFIRTLVRNYFVEYSSAINWEKPKPAETGSKLEKKIIVCKRLKPIFDNLNAQAHSENKAYTFVHKKEVIKAYDEIYTKTKYEERKLVKLKTQKVDTVNEIPVKRKNSAPFKKGELEVQATDKDRILARSILRRFYFTRLEDDSILINLRVAVKIFDKTIDRKFIQFIEMYSYSTLADAIMEFHNKELLNMLSFVDRRFKNADKKMKEHFANIEKMISKASGTEIKQSQVSRFSMPNIANSDFEMAKLQGIDEEKEDSNMEEGEEEEDDEIPFLDKFTF